MAMVFSISDEKDIPAYNENITNRLVTYDWH